MGFWKKRLPAPVYNSLEDFRKNVFGKPKLTYSGEGEDLIIEKFTKGLRKGLYVDVGCYHPKVGSNTYKLFKKGWEGINIDPNPKTIEIFNKYRPKDINLNIGISESGNSLTYYEFEESAISTFSEEFYAARIAQGARFMGKREVKTFKLSEVFDRYLNNRTIDVLDIDVEGIDVEVLKSNNWEKYRPKIVLVEDQDDTIANLNDLETYKILRPYGYKLQAKTISTAIYTLYT